MNVDKRKLCRQNVLLVLVVWLAFIVGEIQGTPLLESLECYNDYNTYVACRYTESVEARKLVNMSLYYWANYSNIKKRQKDLCNMTEPSLNISNHMEWACWRQQTNFALSVYELYIFLPDQELSNSINISLSLNIQLFPPPKPRIERLNTSDFLLTWKTPYDMNNGYLMAGKMQYEVAYKRVWEPWEMSLSMTVSNMSQYILKSSVLIPGSSYVARIRVKPMEDSKFMGRWSEWSSEVHWQVQEEDESKPKNLHCLFNGLDKLTCHWEVRKEMTASLSFTLFYKEGPLEKEKECRPHHQLQIPAAPYVFSSCEINVSSLSTLSQYLIEVRPELKTKTIKPCMNIQPFPPENLTVEKIDTDEYQLSWKSHKLGFIDIEQLYQVRYCKVDGKQKDKEELSHACQWINITKGPKEVFLNVNSQLDPETQYVARVRAHTMTDDPYSCYNGPWSKWSKEYKWQTNKGIVAQDWQWPLSVAVGMILLFVCTYFGYRYLKRAKKQWEDKIPDPRKSKLFITNLQKGYLVLPRFLGGSDFSKPSLTLKDDLCSCSLVLEGKIHDDSDMATKEMEICQMFPSLKHAQGTPWVIVPTENHDFKSSPSMKLSIQDGVSSRSSEHKFFSPSAYNGPYLLCPHAHTLNTLLSELTLVKNMEELAKKLTGYIRLPHCLTESLPVPLANSQPGTGCPPSSLGYIVNPPECCITTTTFTTSGDNKTTEALADGTFQTGNSSTDYLTTQRMQANLQPLQCSMGYVMAPLPGEKQFFPFLSSESKEPHKNFSGQLSSDMDPFSNKNGCEEQGFPQAADIGEGGTLAPPKLLGDYVETSPALANILTSLQPGDSATSQELVASKRAEEWRDDIIMLIPDRTSPVLLQQVGDYCFFPGSKPNEQLSKSHCIEEGKNMDTPRNQQETDDKTGKPKESLKPMDAMVEDTPHAHTIHLMKRLKNDYFMFPHDKQLENTTPLSPSQNE